MVGADESAAGPSHGDQFLDAGFHRLCGKIINMKCVVFNLFISVKFWVYEMLLPILFGLAIMFMDVYECLVY